MDRDLLDHVQLVRIAHLMLIHRLLLLNLLLILAININAQSLHLKGCWVHIGTVSLVLIHQILLLLLMLFK